MNHLKSFIAKSHGVNCNLSTVEEVKTQQIDSIWLCVYSDKAEMTSKRDENKVHAGE